MAVALQYLQDQKKDEAMRKAARANIAGQRAQELGYPSYGMQAAATNAQAAESRGPSYMAALLPYLDQQGGGSARRGGVGMGDDDPRTTRDEAWARRNPYG